MDEILSEQGPNFMPGVHVPIKRISNGVPNADHLFQVDVTLRLDVFGTRDQAIEVTQELLKRVQTQMNAGTVLLDFDIHEKGTSSVAADRRTGPPGTVPGWPGTGVPHNGIGYPSIKATGNESNGWTGAETHVPPPEV